MEIRFSLILPVLGLLLFTAVTLRSAKVNEHDAAHPHKYYWWSSLRLDTDPLNQHPATPPPCGDKEKNCAQDESRTLQVSPNVLDKTLAISGFPAFLAGAGIVALSSRRGIDEVLAFMVSMPILLFGWYYLVGWLVDWLVARRNGASAAPLKLT
jgi:hypothetical protein